MVRGNSYNELRECWPSGMSSNRVYVFKFLTCGVNGILQSVDCGNPHPFNTTSLDTIILLVLMSNTFISFMPWTVI